MIVLTFFIFNDTAPTEIYTLSLHDALPIWRPRTRPRRGRHVLRWRRRSTMSPRPSRSACRGEALARARPRRAGDRKSTRLNSSHVEISYAVFCLKKKKKTTKMKSTHQQADT